MEPLFSCATIPLGTEERRALRRREVRASLEARIREAQMTMDTDIAPEVERLQYEREIVRRLLVRAPEEERSDWEIEESVLHDIAVMRTADLEEQQESIARYQAMLAEIDAEETAASGKD